MARASKHYGSHVIVTRIVAAGQTVTRGKTVKFTSAAGDVQDAGADSDLAIGVCVGGGTTQKVGDTIAAAGQAQIVVSGPIVPMIVGTGASTLGKKQKMAANGVTDAANTGGGTTAEEIVGIAMQSGVLGDEIGVLLGISSRVKA